MSPMELRCDNKLHGLLIIDGHILEMKCNSRFCGHVAGRVVVLHRWDLNTGELIETLKFKATPTNKKEVTQDGTSSQQPAIRSA